MSEQHYRLTVNSAEEAVKILQERFGGKARVVSVRQIEGTGLARYLNAPKLEVIAEVPPEVAAPNPAESVLEQTLAAEKPSAPSIAAEEDDEPVSGPLLLARMVRGAGLSAALLARLQAHASWPEIEKLPASRALTRVSVLLREEFERVPFLPLGDRIAFVGGPAAGKTTALCKVLAGDIFVRQTPGVVLKLDLDSANPGDGLAVFCEALGVPCVWTVADLPPIPPGTSLYVDVPGVALRETARWAELSAALEPLETTARVLVVNAAYEASVIKEYCELGQSLGCTHLVLTHLDDLTHWGKLWEIVLNSGLSPLFLGTGQNVAGDLEENIFSAILSRTFPMIGKEAANSRVAT